MSRNYDIRFVRSVKKDLKKIRKDKLIEVINLIEQLSIDPLPTGAVMLKGAYSKNIYRIRSGDYRIIYEIQDDVLVVLVIKVGHRKDVYKQK